MKLKLTRFQRVMLLAKEMVFEEDKAERAKKALEIIEYLNAEKDENYLRRYYAGN